MSAKNKVFVIVGPTCSGKTSLAVELCKKVGGEIVSFDSRQVCKHMDIGTGKLPINSNVSVKKDDTKWVIDGVTIWGYDLTTPDEYFSAYDYALFALKKIRSLLEEGKNVFLVGGTGFYLDVLTQKRKLSGTKPNFELRKSLENLSTEDLLKQLMSLNPERMRTLDQSNRARIIRALEVELGEKNYATPLPYLSNVDFKFIGLTAPRDFLYARVDTWLDTIWENGLVDEVINLQKMGFGDSPKLSGLVYKSVLAFLKKDEDEKEATQKAKFDLHAYVRRQQTYFKKSEEIKWFDVSQDSFKQNVYNEIDLWVKK